MTNISPTWSKATFVLFILFLCALAKPQPLIAFVSPAPHPQIAVVNEKAIAVVTGSNHSCALTDSGSVKCWGLNDAGQLGDGTILNRNSLVQVQGLQSGVRMIAAGFKHTCALLNTGTVKCWGANDLNQLGNGSVPTYSSTPVTVSSLTNVTLLAAGGDHSCVVTSAGETKCWGSNKSGEISDIANGETLITPFKITGLAGTPTALALGARHSCALVPTGIQCWGNNSFGQLGNGSKNNTSVPTNVSGIGAGTLSIAAGLNHSCAVVSGNTAKCWGANYNFQLGDGTSQERLTPMDVYDLQGSVKMIESHWEFTCAVTTTGAAKCWGKNDVGNLGNNSAINAATPVDVLGVSSGASRVAIGQEHACALLSNGGIKCWGRNNFGQRGDGQEDGQTTAIDVAGLSTSGKQIAAGGNHSCFLNSNSQLKCWGRNTFGQLGDGTFSGRFTPQSVLGLNATVASIVEGDNHSCAVQESGTVQCWGLNSSYQLGDNSNLNRSSPVTVNMNGVLVKSVVAGRRHSCALTTSGAVKCWGNNEYGQLGDGTTNHRTYVVDVSGLNSGVTAIAVGGDSSCALQNGNVRCWGNNSSGQLGNGNYQSSSTPVLVSGISGVPVQVSAGWSHSCAVTNAGTIYCWGQNFRGQLGNNSTEISPSPVAVHTITSGAKQVLVGREHSCALVNSGVKCWGNNSAAQLGDGTIDYRTKPVDVVNLTQGVRQLTVGLYHGCVLMNDGAASGFVKCWGYGDYGQLGSNPGWTATDTVGFGTVPPPTAQPTPTATPTRRVLPTEVTPTLSRTPSPTPSHTPSHTPSPTPLPATATATASATNTSTQTQTPTATPTATTHIATSTPTIATPGTETPVTETPATATPVTETPATSTATATSPIPTTDTETPTPTKTSETPPATTKFTVNLPIVARQSLPTPTPRVWQRVTADPSYIDTLAINDSAHFFLGSRGDVFEQNGIHRAFTCAATTFPNITQNMDMRDLTFSGQRGIAATDGQGIYFSRDNGNSWLPTTSQTNNYVFSVIFTSATQAYAATDNKLYISKDSGETWGLVYDGVDPSRLNELYYDPATGILWIGSYDMGLWKLLPNAPTAQSFNDGFSAQSQEINEIVYKDGIFYIGTSDGIYKGDGNSAWQPFGLQGSYILSLEIVGDTLYAGIKEQSLNGASGQAKGIWLRPINAASNWLQDAPNTHSLEVNELLYVANGSCQALFAATDDGLWKY